MPGGESEFLDWVRARNPHAGDDLAVLPLPNGLPNGLQLLAGVDPVLDGVHLHVAEHGHRAAGRKAVNRNLSDLAAMGGRPTGLLLSLIVPNTASQADVREIYLGAEAAAKQGGCEIVGGDFASWPGPLAVTVTVLGVVERPIPRVGVRSGQRLFVTGPLGGSLLGRHLAFAPRLAAGQRLAAQADAIGLTAMMDLSDGLSRDLPRLLAGHGALLDAAKVPVHADAERLSRDDGQLPLWHALNDGEDYELLFAAGTPPKDVMAHEIGQVEGHDGIRLLDQGNIVPVPSEGWEHPLKSPTDAEG